MIVFFQSSYSVYSIYNLTNNVLMARSIEADSMYDQKFININLILK